MAIFLGVHKIPQGFTDTQVKDGWEEYKKSAIAKGLKPISVVASLEKGFAYCQTEAKSANEVREAHANVAIPLEDVIEVKKMS